ncbi:MAG: S41 family peptidase, partial [Oleibacter sp.]|nr:S41 family peptidase [Thalassolituus sp.]
VFERIRSSYVEEVDDQTLFNNAIKGMLSSLDPHSAYLQEDDFSDLRETTAGKFGGLGIEVGMENGMIRVITPIDDTPAQRAGINAGDLIVTLDGESVMGLTLNDAIERMRGEPGSDIQLEVQRGSEKKLLSFTITRAEIKVASVRSEMLSNGIGYLRITQFQDKTGSEMRDALTEMKEQQSLQGIILDLRNNPGGVLNAAVDVVDSFISEGLIVYTEGRSKDSDIRYLASSNTISPNVPMVILINGGSASASEIVAGALQDHKRAVIVGTRSFGKGSVQTILPITETSAVKMTTARYFTPNGRSIQAQGIAPDIDVAQGEVNITEERFYKESDLPGHLSNPDGQTEGGDLNVRDSELLKRDFQLYEAHTLLRGVNVLNLSKQ